MTPPPRSRVRRLAGVGFALVVFLFLGLTIVRQSQELGAYEWQLHPSRLAISLALHVGVLCFGVLVWGYTLRQFDYRLSYPILARVWFLSNIARYVPGKVWQFVGVAGLMRRVQVPGLVAVTSVLVYMGYVLIAAWFVGLYLLPDEMIAAVAQPVRVARLLSPLLLILLHPGVLRMTVRVVARLTRQELAPWTGSWLTGLLLLLGGTVMWLGFGAAFQLFVAGVTDAPSFGYNGLTSSFALAFLAGYAVIIAPAGLGAKEAALTGLLAPVFPLSVAAAVAVGTRLWSTVAETLSALFFLRESRPVQSEP